MYRNILVPLDGSETALCGLREAVALARTTPSTLHLLHVLMDMPLMAEMGSAADHDAFRMQLLKEGERILAKGLHEAALAGVECVSALREGRGRRIADVIVDEAEREHCGLIAMGTHGRRGFSRAALGSDAETVARMSPVPVLLVRHGGNVAEGRAVPS